MIDISLIIINYLNYWDTLSLLNDIRNQRDVAYKCIVIDNASPNDSIRQLKRVEDPKIDLIVNKENVGYARAINQGIEQSLHDGIKYSLILNSDIQIPNPEFTVNMIDAMRKRPDYAVMGPLIYDDEGKLNKIFSRRPSFMEMFSGEILSKISFNKRRNLYRQRDEVLPVYRISGSCMLINNMAIKMAGLLDEHTFLFGEEEILAERVATQQLFTGLYLGEKIVHRLSASIDLTISPLKKALLQTKSKSYYLREYRHYSPFCVRVTVSGFFLVTMTKYLVQAVQRIVTKG